MPTDSPAMLQLATARRKASASSTALSNFLYGSVKKVARRRAITALIEDDPAFSRVDRPFLNHTQRYLRSIAKCAAFHLKCEDLGLGPGNSSGNDKADELRWAYEAVDEILPTDVHMAMFIPALEHQTSPEQKAAWLPLAQSFKILGAYVQTELGHGSNVRALETTATFDAAADEFVVHSPTLSSTKWWPGGLGKTATHCVLHARLLLPSTTTTSSSSSSASSNLKDMGVHAFFVPLRSVTTHEPFPGVQLGDIGPKLGFNSIDNGWARFDRYRIPRENLLGGVAKVAKGSGAYERVAGGEKRMYGAMLDVRANIVSKAAVTLAKALTIAVRYSLVRLQGYREGRLLPQQQPEEQPVLEYPTQQRLLLPWLGWCFALHFTGHRFRDNYNRFLAGDESGAPLGVLHMESSGLKALITQRVSDAIEQVRKLCGGHGYSALSGLPEISNNYLALATLEGTAQVLEPQTARFLLRLVVATATGKAMDGASKDVAPYLFDDSFEAFAASTADSSSSTTTTTMTTTMSSGDLTSALASSPRSSELHLLAMGRRAQCLARAAAAEIQTRTADAMRAMMQQSGSGGGGKAAEPKAAEKAAEKVALAASGVMLGRLTRAHSEFVLLRDMVTAMDTLKKSSSSMNSSSGSSRSGRLDGSMLGASELAALAELSVLFGLSLLDGAGGDLTALGVLANTPTTTTNASAAAMKGGSASGGNAAMGAVGRALGESCDAVAPEAIALVDAWDFTDAQLGHSVS